MEKGYKESHYNGRRQCDGIRVKDVADIYRDINGLRKGTDLKERLVRRDRTNKILVLIIIGLVDVIFGGGIWINSLHTDNKEYAAIEWMYCAQHAQTHKAEEIVTDIERTFLHGDKKTREKWQEVVMKSEKNSYKFNCFFPHDDWQPRPEEEATQDVAPVQSVSKRDELSMPPRGRHVTLPAV